MSKLKYLFIAMIFSGLVLAEAVPIWSKVASPAKSQSQFDGPSIFDILPSDNQVSTPLNPNFPNLDLPRNPGEILDDLIRSSGMVGSSNLYANPVITLPNSLGSQTTTPVNEILQGVLPPIGSELYYAYQDGGRAWYERGDNVLVLYTDGSIHSFSKKTGKSTTWMQDRLAYPPINDAGAYTNYQKNYNAEIVAQTDTWVLMEFPSGGLVKVMKPQYSSTPLTTP